MAKKDSASTTEPRLDPAKVRVAAQPIIWSSDDFPEFGGEIPLSRCLAEIKAAGYAGAELGHKFPKDAPALGEALQEHGLSLASGWHSSYLASRPLTEERADFARHADLLAALGCGVAIVAECTGRTYHQPDAPMGRGSCRAALDAAQRKTVAQGLDVLAEMAGERGLALAYHPHMGTVVEGEDEIDALMSATRGLKLLVDTGHSAFAGLDPLSLLRRYRERVAHVHLKNVRPSVVAPAAAEKMSFKDAIGRGVFTVPGDGGLDFAPLFAELARARYEGWLVVEAEQDPRLAPPLEYARRAREYVKAAAGV